MLNQYFYQRAFFSFFLKPKYLYFSEYFCHLCHKLTVLCQQSCVGDGIVAECSLGFIHLGLVLATLLFKVAAGFLHVGLECLTL